MGVVVAISGGLGLATGATWLLIAFFFRYSSLASLIAAVFAPVYYLMGDGVAWRSDNAQALSLVIISGFLIWRHSENISRLVKGTESKLGKKS
jgi:glycerol-3-phosphate acyltransferase PlsY